MKRNQTHAALSPFSVTAAIVAAVLLQPFVLFALWRLGASPFQLFAIPIILTTCAISVWMAIHWHEWRAMPISVVTGMIVVRQGMQLGMAGGLLKPTLFMELLSEVILWAAAPLGFAAVAYLWRIFENQERFAHAQTALEANERKYRHLVENAKDAFYMADEKGRFTLLNTGGARIFGRRGPDLIGMCLFDLIAEEYGNDIRTALARQLKNDASSFYHEFPVTGRNGNVTWVGENLQAIIEHGTLCGFQAVMRDMSEKRFAEEALQRSEGRLRTLFESISDGIIQSDHTGNIVLANRAAEHLLALPTDKLLARSLADTRWEFLRPDGLPMPVEEWAGCRAHQEKSAAREAVTGIRCANGSIRWLNINALPLCDGETDETKGVVVTLTDISKIKEAEENIRIVEFALDNADEQVFMLDRPGTIVYANRRAMSVLGYEAEEIRSKTIHDIDHQLSREDWAETWRLAKSGAWPTSESIYIAKNGKSFPAITSSSYFEFKGQGYIFAFVRDISQETNLASQLRQAQKMEAIGTLAGGIAHDFNNILSAIVGYTELAIGEAPADGNLRTFLAEVKKATNRATDLVRQILTFSRNREHVHHPLILGPVVKEALKLLRGSLPSTIELRGHIQEQCNPVMSDPVQIHQVLMNLCTNAFQAIGNQGGIIEVSLKEVDIAAEEAVNYLNITPGKFVQLVVKDTGCGMNEETRHRIFEPFFTTKPEGEGTGLGLTTVHGIVTSQKGAIRIESEPGKGTTFTVILPVCLDAGAPLEKRSDEQPEKGSERVLLVDDEKQIADSSCLALEKLGYAVHGYCSGVEALKQLLAAPGSFDILVTDYTMPGMTGLDLAKAAHAARPELPIILCTGLNGNIDDTEAVGIRAVLKKPLSIVDLSKGIRMALGSTGKRQG